MARRICFTLMLIASFSASAVMAYTTTSRGEPKTIKQVMKLAHKDGLLKKIQAGEASPEEKQQLLDLYIDMLEATPSKGDANEWKMVAGAATLSAAKVVLGREGALEELKKTTDCAGCHKQFK